MSVPDAEEAKRKAGESLHWERLWAGGLPEGAQFDNGFPSPVLVHVLKTERDALSRTSTSSTITDAPSAHLRVLVPGGGRGYDALFCATTLSAFVVNLDLSETGTARAAEWLAKNSSSSDSSSGAAGSAEAVCGNFFETFRHFEDPTADRFDFVWDCTFLCAIDPEARGRWAKRHSQLLKPQTGQLWTLIFPVWGERSEAGTKTYDFSKSGSALMTAPGNGPPFELSFGLLEHLLAAEGFECVKRVTWEELQAAGVPVHIDRSPDTGRPVANEVACWRLKGGTGTQ